MLPNVFSTEGIFYVKKYILLKFRFVSIKAPKMV